MNEAPLQALLLADDTRIAVLSDWRQISYAQRGSLSGRPVFVFHDLAGSRMQQHPDRSLAPGLGLHLIHPDRPGCGMSTPLARRSFRDWASDVSQLADMLHVDQFAIAGIGGGAPFALACAAYMPERVTRVALASGYAPPDMLGKAHWRLRAKLRLARRWPSLLRLTLKKDSYRARNDAEQYLNRLAARLGRLDAQLLDNLLLRGQYRQDAREAFRQSTRGVRADLALLAHPWNIPLEHIRSEVALWHGTQDRVVPIEAARQLADLFPRAQLHQVADAGHLAWYSQWPAILAFLRS